MERLTILSAVATTLMLISPKTAYADDPVPSPLTIVQAKHVFVPVGFDSNDEVQAIVDGYLPDTCYKLAFNETVYDEATKTYKIIQWARKFSGVCIEVMVPFFAEVRLGRLPAGDYAVESTGSPAKTLNVSQATDVTGPDDYLYAPVDSVRVEYDPVQQRFVGVIEGRFTNSCMEWQELRLIDSGESLQLLPIIALATRADCTVQEVQFSREVTLPAAMTIGRHLLHVRSLNGKAVNVVFSVYPTR